MAVKQSYAPTNSVARPGLVSRIKSEFIRRTLFPAIQKRWHPSANRYLQEFKKYEFASLKDVQAIQWSKLQALLEHASACVPYYRNLFRAHEISAKDIASPRDFARIPVLPCET